MISCPAAGALFDPVLLGDIAVWSWAAGAVGAVGAAGAIGITGSITGTTAAACISAAIVSSISESAYRVKHKSQIFTLCLQHECKFEPEFPYIFFEILVSLSGDFHHNSFRNTGGLFVVGGGGSGGAKYMAAFKKYTYMQMYICKSNQ